MKTMIFKYSITFILFLVFIACFNNQNNQIVEETVNPVSEENKDISTFLESEVNKDNNETESVMYYVRAHNYLEQKNFLNAEKFFDTVIKLEPEFSRAWLGRATSKFYQDKYESSLSDLNKSIELKNDLGEAYLLKSIILLELKDLENSEKEIINFETLVPPEWPILIRARIYGERGEFNKSEDLFAKSISISSDPTLSYWWRAKIRANFNKLEDSIDDFKEAIFLDPNNPKLYLDRAKVLINNNQDLEKIIIDLKEAESLAKEPRLPIVYKEAKNLLKQFNK
tara:strand:+ start:903 stop:1751 length:849 start_codon:yes stop_codon:yes gene_type:complete